MPANIIRVTCYLFFLCYGFCTFTYAQDKEAESLLAEIKKAQKDTTKANLYNKLAVHYLGDDPNKADAYAQQAYALSHDAQFSQGKARALQIQGVIAQYTGQYDKALSKSHQALRLCKEINDEKKIYSILNNIGNIHDDQGNYEEALKYYFQALEYAEQAQDKEILSIILGNIGATYGNQGDNVKTIEYTLKALKIYEEMDDQEGIGTSLYNIGLLYIELDEQENALKFLQRGLKVYKSLNEQRGVAFTLHGIGQAYFRLKNYKLARKYYLQALNIREEIQDELGISITLNHIGDLYVDLKEYDKALEYLNQALSIKQKIGDTKGEVYCLKGIADIYMAQENYDNAQGLAHQCLSLAQKIDSKPAIEAASEILSDIYKTQKDFAKALEYYELHTAYKDSIFTEAKDKEINRLMLSREEDQNEKLQKENELQRQKIKEKNIIAISIGLGSLLVILLAVVWYRASVRYKRISSSLFQRNLEVNQQKEEIESQAEELRRAYLKISEINESLEEKVKERTAELEQQNKYLSEYAFINAHLLRGPLANIMGIVGLLEDMPREESEQQLIDYLKESTDKLNNVVHKINEAVQSGKHFGREGISSTNTIEENSNIS